jgi:hypothetical protein
MHAICTKRTDSAGVWLDAILFGVKLVTVVGAVSLLIWHMTLPPNRSHAQSGFDHAWYASQDFVLVAFSLSALYLLAAALLTVGGLLQFWKFSRRTAVWNLAFGAFALIVGIVLLCISPPNGYHEIFRPVANQASAGNCTGASCLQFARLGRAAPDRQRYAAT